jgi:hypothetical protein
METGSTAFLFGFGRPAVVAAVMPPFFPPSGVSRPPSASLNICRGHNPPSGVSGPKLLIDLECCVDPSVRHNATTVHPRGFCHASLVGGGRCDRVAGTPVHAVDVSGGFCVCVPCCAVPLPVHVDLPSRCSRGHYNRNNTPQSSC